MALGLFPVFYFTVMPITANDYLKSLQFVVDKIPNEVEKIVYNNEELITRSNIEQIENHLGSDGLFLKNDNPRFTGAYSKFTASINPKKTQGTLYTFFETGAFLGNFFVDVLPDKKSFEIDSTGTGSGEKAEFFAGYPHLFGLTKEDQETLNWDVIYPELMEFINKYV
jgi:hypothetical protein